MSEHTSDAANVTPNTPSELSLEKETLKDLDAAAGAADQAQGAALPHSVILCVSEGCATITRL